MLIETWSVPRTCRGGGSREGPGGFPARCLSPIACTAGWPSAAKEWDVVGTIAPPPWPDAGRGAKFLHGQAARSHG